MMNLANIMLIALPGGSEWIVIVIILVLLFGGRKIPELMKGLGQGMKEFKKARNEEADKKSDDKETVDKKTGE